MKYVTVLVRVWRVSSQSLSRALLFCICAPLSGATQVRPPPDSDAAARPADHAAAVSACRLTALRVLVAAMAWSAVTVTAVLCGGL